MTTTNMIPPAGANVPLLAKSNQGGLDSSTDPVGFRQPAVTAPLSPTKRKPGSAITCRRIVDILALQQVLPILLLIAYSFLGAWMFSYVESEHYLEKLERRQLEHRTQRGLLNYRIMKSNTFQEPEATRLKAFNRFEKMMECKPFPTNETTWDMWSGMFYAASLYTTIGYGNIAPVTDVGRALSIPYTLFGVPLVLLILRDLGRMFFSVIASACGMCSFRRRQKLMPMPGHVNTQINEVSLIPLVLILVIWLPIWALIYVWWEPQWNYLKAFYFVFLSFSTVGLGDLMPTGSKNMVFSYFLVIFGLSLLSMIWAAAQAKVEATFYRYRAVIDSYYAHRAIVDPVEGEVYFEDSIHQPPHSPDGRMLYIPPIIHSRMACADRLFYYAFMDAHRKRLLLEQCRVNTRKANKVTQTGGVLRKSSSSERRPIQFQGDRNRSPTKTVNFQVLDHETSNSDPRITENWSEPVGSGNLRTRPPANPATAASTLQQQQRGSPGSMYPALTSPGQRNPRLVGRGKSPESDTFSTNSFTTAVTSFPSDGVSVNNYEERRPTIASSSSDAMLNDFLFPEVNLVTRDPVTSRVMQMQGRPQDYRRGSAGVGGPFA